jgi:hypothetical protein
MRRLLLALLIVLATPAVAEGRTIQQDIDAAQRYWHTDLCRGEWNVILDPGLTGRALDGETRFDWRWDGASWELYAPCEFTLDPASKGCERESAIRHEIGHVLLGPAHEGRMAKDVLDAVPCEGARRERAKQKRVKARWRAERRPPKAGEWWPVD